MTDSDFQTQLSTLSPKIGDAIAKPGGDTFKSQLGSLAMKVTATADVDSALAALKTDSAKLKALEDEVSASIAAAPTPSVPAIPTPSALAPSIPQTAPPVTPSVSAPARGYMWVGPIISFAIIAGFFTMLGILMWQQHSASTTAGTSPSGLQNVLFTLLGALGAAFTQVVNFWLGSSKGSSDKTDLLAASPPIQVQDQQQASG